ncbi:C4-dicarboxylate TRAP transporter substrate-binding protein [Thermodesulfobacteriota bacterium]
MKKVRSGVLSSEAKCAGVKTYLFIALLLMFFSVFCVNVGEAVAADKPIKFRLAQFSKAGAGEGVVMKWWGDEIMKRSGGKIKIEYYFGQKLVKMREQFDAIRTGMADIGTYVSVWMPAKAPIFTIGGMPGMPTDDTYTAVVAATRLGRTKAAQAEFTKNNVHFLTGNGHSGDYIYSNKPINRLADLKGLSVASWGYYSRAFTIWGAKPASIPSPEIYEAIKRGVVNGCNKPLFQAVSIALYEVAPYILMPKIGINVVVPLVMNLDKWKSLPPDVKKIFEEVSAEYPKKHTEIFKKIDEDSIAFMKAKGMTFTKLPDADLAKMKGMAAPLWDKWAEDMDKKGLPGTELKNKYYGWLQE